jgi:hypothetical protein
MPELCPMARCGTQIRVDRTGLDIVDRDAPVPTSLDKPCVNVLTAPFADRRWTAECILFETWVPRWRFLN